MKITFIGHASILIETQGLKILSDPWWGFPCFGAQWWTYPKPATQLIDPEQIDYVYISHGHHDHFHLGTLNQFKHHATILVSSEVNLAETLTKKGYQVQTVTPEITTVLANKVECEVWPTYGGDTLMAISDGSEVCVNANDALHAAPTSIQDQYVDQLLKRFDHIDYFFCGYGVASHFPNCYKIPAKNYEKTAIKRQKHFNQMWGRIVARLKPSFAFPFAADVALLDDDLIWSNKPTHDSGTPVSDLKQKNPQLAVTMAHIAPGFMIDSQVITHPVVRQEFNEVSFRDAMKKEIVQANRHVPPNATQIDDIKQLIIANIDRVRPYLVEYQGNYTFKVIFHGTGDHIVIQKQADDITCEINPKGEILADVTMKTRGSYLKRSLSTPYAAEVLFVGSGTIIEYRAVETAFTNLHNELKVIVSYRRSSPKSRYGDNSPISYRLKSTIKQLLGRHSSSLYDLSEWTVLDSTPTDATSSNMDAKVSAPN